MAKLSFGSLYWATPAATVLGVATPLKAAGTTAAMVVGDFTASTSNRLTYTAATTRTFEVTATCSGIKSGGGTTVMSFYIYKNDIQVPGAVVNRTSSSATDEGAFAITCQTTLAQNQYVELWVETDDGDDLTINAGTLCAKVVG